MIGSRISETGENGVADVKFAHAYWSIYYTVYRNDDVEYVLLHQWYLSLKKTHSVETIGIFFRNFYVRQSVLLLSR